MDGFSDLMRGLWLEDGRARLRDDLPVPTPPEGEALVRVLRAGLCNTDLELVRGYYPFRGVLGHEFVGTVERGPAPLIGRRVVGEINAVCGACRHCAAGRRTHCERRTVLGIVDRHGAFAEYLALPAQNLHPVPDQVSTDAAVFAEPLAAALEVAEQVQVRPDDRVLVAGDGKLGQLVARALGLAGCEVVVAGRHSRKLALLAASGIRTVSVPSGTGDPEAPERAEASGEGASYADAGSVGEAEALEPGSFDLAVECTGNRSGFALARRALRPRGTLVLKSTYAGRLTLDASSVVVDELVLVGSRCGPFPPALRMLATGRVEVEALIDARYPLAQAEAALERAGRRDTLKVLLDVA